jgi:hypothetical protein
MAADLDCEDNDADDEQVYAALAADDDDVNAEDEELSDQDCEDEAHALAALSIDKLLNW